MLRQIEVLQVSPIAILDHIFQASNTERMKVWEELERSLTVRLNEAETRAQKATERERNAVAQMNEAVSFLNG